MEQTRPRRRRKQKSGEKAKIITVELIAFVFLAVYLIGYTVSMIKKPNVSVETVASGHIDVPRQFTGLLIRDETVTFSNEAGNVVFSYGEKEYVKKDSVVCIVRDKEELAPIEKELETISDSILAQQEKKNNAPAQLEEINRINTKMKSQINDSLPVFMTGSGNEVYRFKKQLEADINDRNSIYLSDSGGALSALVDKKSAFERQLQDATGTYAAIQGGILSYDVDGLEGELTPDKLSQITKEQVETPAPVLHSGDGGAEAGSPLFKIVNSNLWYMCAFFDNETVLDWKEGTNKLLYFKDAGGTRQLVMKIVSIDFREDKTFVVFSSPKYMLDFIDKRHVVFSIEDDSYKGLKIPNSAIIQKTALMFPDEYIYEAKGTSGVYVKENNSFVFKSVNILSKKEGIAYVLQSFNSVQLDTVVYHYKDGRGIDEGSYKIEDILTVPGVYVANSGTAEFRQIEVIKKNEFYSIIEKGTGYGVKSFDSIVSDATVVTDNQIIR